MAGSIKPLLETRSAGELAPNRSAGLLLPCSGRFWPPRPIRHTLRWSPTMTSVGEAKRRKEAVRNGPCPCGSAKPARLCCFNGRDWHKPPAVLGLNALPPALRIRRCYLKELGSCAGPISGEHII